MEIVIAILATYRLAHLITEDDGPFYIFKRLRLFTDAKALKSQKSGKDELSFWPMLNDGIHCVFCIGLYAAILCGALTFWPTAYGNIFLLIMAVAGGQSFVQRKSE